MNIAANADTKECQCGHVLSGITQVLRIRNRKEKIARKMWPWGEIRGHHLQVARYPTTAKFPFSSKKRLPAPHALTGILNSCTHAHTHSMGHKEGCSLFEKTQNLTQLYTFPTLTWLTELCCASKTCTTTTETESTVRAAYDSPLNG